MCVEGVISRVAGAGRRRGFLAGAGAEFFTRLRLLLLLYSTLHIFFTGLDYDLTMTMTTMTILGFKKTQVVCGYPRCKMKK